MVRRDRFEELAPQLSVARLQDPARPRCNRAWQAARPSKFPTRSAARQHGESKLDSMVALDFLGLVLAKLTNDVVSLRFLLFAMVGGIGLVVHLTTLFIALKLFKVPFAEAQAAGAIVAMTSNFILNNFLTYRDQRLRGFAILSGLIAVLHRLQRRPARQCRRRLLGLRPGADLVARRHGRRADGRGLELRDVRTVRLAQEITHHGWGLTRGSSATPR